MLDGDRIIRRRYLSQIWGVHQVLMEYTANTPSTILRLKDGLQHDMPRQIKRGLSNWYHSTVPGTTPITTLCGTRFRSTALVPQRTTG